MDWALWDPSVSQESSYFIGQGWQCDFYFGYGIDEIEENALNEKFCIEVLRILITKADTEIVELEEDLVILESQLAWADEEWSKICSAALREKIGYLDNSIRSLKNENVQAEHDFDVCLLMHREPAESMHEIVKALLRNYFQQKDEQSEDVIVKESSSDGPGHATDLLVEKKRLSNSASDSIRKEEVKEPSNFPAEKHAILNSSLKPLAKKTNNPGTVKRANTIVKGSSLDSSRPAAVLANEKKMLCNFDSKSSRKVEANKHGLARTENFMTQKSCLKAQMKRTNHLETPTNTVVQNSISNAKKLAMGHSNEERNLNDSDSKISSEKVTEKSSTPTPPILDLPLKPEKKRTDAAEKDKVKAALSPLQKRTDVAEKDKHEDTMIKDSSSDALRHETENSSEKRELSKFDLKVNQKEVKKHNSTPKNRSNFSNSSLKSAGKGTSFPKRVKPACVIEKDSNSDASRDATGIKGKNKLSKIDATGIKRKNKLSKIDARVNGEKEVKEQSSTDISITLKSSLKPGGKGTNTSEIEPADTILDSRSDALKQVTEDSKAKPTLSEGPETAQTDKIDPSNSSPNTERKRIKTPKRMNGQEASLTDIEHTAAHSLLNLLNHQSEDTTKPRPKKERKPKPKPKQVLKAELAATDDDSNSNLSLKPQRQRTKRKLQSNPVGVQEPGFSPVEIGSGSSSISKTKRQRKSRMTDSKASFNQSADRGTKKKKAQSDLCLAEEHGVNPDVSIKSDLPSRKKRKRSSNSPTFEKIKELRGLQISLAKLHDETTDSTTEEDLWITECSFSTLTVVDLKAIAKQHNLRGCHKLRKAELAERLGLMIQGGKKEKREESSPLLMV